MNLENHAMFNKLRKILAKKNGIKMPEYQQIFNNVIGYDDIKQFRVERKSFATTETRPW